MEKTILSSIYPFYMIARRTGEQKANKEGKAREREGKGAGGDDCGDAGRVAGGGKTTLDRLRGGRGGHAQGHGSGEGAGERERGSCNK
nr:MAG TPA: hypothetical protein [Caudoviricetes sp.]